MPLNRQNFFLHACMYGDVRMAIPYHTAEWCEKRHLGPNLMTANISGYTVILFKNKISRINLSRLSLQPRPASVMN